MKTIKDQLSGSSCPEPNSGCILWVGKLNEHGYGIVSVDNKHRLAHRVSYEVNVGPINEFCVCHRCDTPACINPDHLFLGTHVDNIRDKVAKRRNILASAKRCTKNKSGWQAQYTLNKKTVYVGLFATQAEAHAAATLQQSLELLNHYSQ